MYPRTHFELIDRMKKTVADGKSELAQAFVEREVTRTQAYRAINEQTEVHVEMVDLVRRYRLEDHETSFLVNELGDAQYGFQHACSGADKILEKDYGLHCC
jgi:hypothetical protein